jgi:RHS repeat-associated protein
MPLFRRVLAGSLISTQILFGVPMELWAQTVPPAGRAGQPASPSVPVNRRVPAVTPPPSRPVLSTVPTDGEILRARVLPEPLVPIGQTAADVNVALGSALLAYVDQREPDTLGPVGRFMETHPTSPWQPSLLLNAGLVFLHQGFITRAAHYFRYAWTLSKDVPGPAARTIADQAVGQLLQLESRLGHADVVEALIAEVGTRPLAGAASEQFSNAKQAVWVMRHAPEEAFRCGPYALAQMIRAVKAQASLDGTLLMTRTGPDGLSLAGLAALSRASGQPATPIVRETGAEFGIPGVIHLKAGHFTAVVRHEGDRYLLRDGTLSAEMWVTATALNEEASGAMLVPEGRIPAGWRAMTIDDASKVWGRGLATEPDPTGPAPTGPGSPPCACGGNGPGPGGGGNGPGTMGGSSPGMATYRAHLMEVSLNVYDTPVGYSPTIGPAVQFTVTYNQRESHQPQIFSYSNLGPQWTMDWISYVTDDPANADAAVAVFLRGGGEEPHSGYDSGTGRFAMNTREHVMLLRTSSSPIRYERLLPDGSKEVFAQADGASAYPRRVFMTQSIDPHGNALTFTYDGQLRLVGITDAVGQVTTLSYELPQDVWKVTKVTDPFGRAATFAYDMNLRLQRITDVIALWSAFAYSADGFLTSLTTPYGTSRFTKADSGYNRTLEMTDPLGGTERLEYRANDLGMSAQEVSSAVPVVSGLTFNNNFLQYRNTLYWDRQAMAVGAGDRTKAHLYHWLHVRDNVNQTVAVVESEKAALENRVWYLYPNQASSVWEGDGRSPSATGRVLDDGTTQAYQADYNAQGQVTRRADPLGRETSFTYAANGIDLLTVRQKNGQGSDLLETRTWNAAHEPLTTTDAAGQTTAYTYSSAGQIVTVTNAKSETTTYSYNTPQQLTSVSGPVSGATTAFTYDGYGRRATTTDSDSYSATTTYDAFDRPVQTAYPDGTTDQTQYTRLDVARRKDRFNRWTTFTHDAMRRQSSVRDPLGRVVQQEWCTCGGLNALIDPNGRRTSWDRDILGRVTKETRVNGSFTTYVYETTISRLKKVTDPKLQDTNYSYFVDGTLQQTTYTNAVIATPSVSFTYDAAYGRVATMVDGTGTTTYGYHEVGTTPTLGVGRLVTVDGPLTDDTITYGYDELGRVTNRSINGTANPVTWTFDALGRIASEDNLLGTFTYTYDGPTGRIATVSYPNSQTSSYSYYGNSTDRRLQTIHHKYPNGATLSKFDYTYDAAGNILTWREQANTTAVLWTYGYDTADQLTSAVKASTDAAPGIVTRYAYTYDRAGNRTVEQIDDAVNGASYDNMNRLVAQHSSGALRLEGTVSETATVTVGGKSMAVSSTGEFSGSIPIVAGTTSFTVSATDPSGNSASRVFEVDGVGSDTVTTFDADGNTTSDGSRTFAWNAAGRLSEVSLGSSRVAITYDGFGREQRRTLYQDTNVAEMATSLWCGLELCERRDASSGEVVWRNEGLGEIVGSQRLFLVTDHLGSVREALDIDGNLRARYAYTAYGRRSKIAGDSNSRWGFAGSRVADFGLSDAVFRSYDPATGRWLSQDPMGLAAVGNLYQYVGNGPTNASDPSGLLQGPLITVGTRVLLGAEAATLGEVTGAFLIGWGIGTLIDQYFYPPATNGAADKPQPPGSSGGQNPDVDGGRRTRGNQDPVSYIPFNPGRGCDGGCKPCPKPEKWSQPGNAHGSTDGIHWHWIEWNQNKSTCICYPMRRDGANEPW